MSLVICSDIHVGKYRFGKVDRTTGVSIRTMDVLKNFDQAIDFAIKKKVSAFVITGDIKPFVIIPFAEDGMDSPAKSVSDCVVCVVLQWENRRDIID